MQVTNSHSRSARWQKAALLVAVLMSANLTMAVSAHAGIDTVLQNVINMMSGTVAKSLAIIAVMLTGFAWMFGHLDMRKAGMVIFGIALVFGASEIVGAISG